MPDGFRELKRRIVSEYAKAYRELDAKGKEFADRSRLRELEMRGKLKNGEITQTQFDSWMRGQVFQGQQWEDKKRQMAEILRHADETARAAINDQRFNEFAQGHNRFAYELSKDAGMILDFTLYDEDTVRRLIKEKPDLLPPRGGTVNRNRAYNYYNRLMDRIATQGILQGESVPQIARRIARQTGESATGAALRNARTMQTSAQNAGRLEGMHRAQDMGIKLKKMWISTLDGRTRDSHRDLDGKIQDIDKPFDSPLGDIMFPGDPDAAPGNVWNCRCTLGNSYMEYPYEILKRRDNETREFVENMTYRQWEEMKEGLQHSADSDTISKKVQDDAAMLKQYDDLRRVFSKGGGQRYGATLENTVVLREEERIQENGKWVSRYNETGTVEVPKNENEEFAMAYVLPKGNKSFNSWDNTPNTIMTDGRIAVNYRTGNGDAMQYKISEMIENEVAILGGVREEGVYYRVTSNPKDAEYIRNGSIRPSKNHASGEKEDGLSVWEFPKYYDKYLERVTGDIVGIGADGEPLLDVKTVKLLGVNDIDIKEKMEDGKRRFCGIYGWTREQLDNVLLHRMKTTRL